MTDDIRLTRWPDNDPGGMQRLADALRQIATVVAASRARSAEPIVIQAPAFPELPSELDRARALLRQTRARAAAFGAMSAGLFAEPAWDMLLDLFIAHEESRVWPLAEFAGNPTRMRWVGALDGYGLVRRWHADSLGVEVVSLAPDAVTLMLCYLENV